MADFLTGNGVEAPVAPKSALAPSTSGDLSEGGFKEGWLEKRGAIRKNWKRRYFRLQNNELKYYKRALDKYPNQSPQGEIPLEGSSCEFVPEEKYGKKYCFELHTIITKRVYVLVAFSGTDMQDWLTEIRKAMLRIRRQKSKQVPSRRVTILLQEQEAEARKRVSNSITERELKSPQPTAAVLSPRKSPAAVVSPRGHTRSNSASNNPGTVLPDGREIPSDVSVDEKYNMYLEWLQETKSHQRRGTVSERPPSYSMHERLLPDDGRPTSPFYTNCCKYGNCTIS